MNTKRLKEIERLELKTGAHKSLSEGGCIMELVSYVAGEPWSDAPKCACPILTRYSIALNDQFTDEHRQLLKPFIVKLLDTKSTDEIQIARKRLLMWRNVTALYPEILDLYKMTELASDLRKLPNEPAAMLIASDLLKANKEKIYADANADADANANAYAYADANADADANANAYAYADADADVDAYAYANAYAYADANADANADALRKKLADIAIETLRLAIEEK